MAEFVMIPGRAGLSFQIDPAVPSWGNKEKMDTSDG